jgi:hypothetical protein
MELELSDSGEQMPLGTTNNTSSSARFNWELVHCGLAKNGKAIETDLEMIKHGSGEWETCKKRVFFLGER